MRAGGRASRTGSANEFTDTTEIARTLNQIAQPFDRTFSRQDLADLLDRLDQSQRDPPVALAA